MDPYSTTDSERDATRKELADEADSELACLERLEIERQRVWSDED